MHIAVNLVSVHPHYAILSELGLIHILIAHFQSTWFIPNLHVEFLSHLVNPILITHSLVNLVYTPSSLRISQSTWFIRHPYCAILIQLVYTSYSFASQSACFYNSSSLCISQSPWFITHFVVNLVYTTSSLRLFSQLVLCPIFMTNFLVNLLYTRSSSRISQSTCCIPDPQYASLSDCVLALKNLFTISYRQMLHISKRRGNNPYRS